MFVGPKKNYLIISKLFQVTKQTTSNTLYKTLNH